MNAYREVLGGAKYRTGADFWSFGALIYEIVTGEKPYADYEFGVQILTAVIIRKEIPEIQVIEVISFCKLYRPELSSSWQKLSCLFLVRLHTKFSPWFVLCRTMWTRALQILSESVVVSWSRRGR